MAATTLTYDDAALQRMYQDIRSQSCVDRSAKLQLYCELVWDRLEHHSFLADSIQQDLVTLLQDDIDILLARLVIPDLRPDAPTSTNPIKQKLLQQINPSRPSLELLRTRPETSNATAKRLYEEEKKILQDAELYRAAILLYGHGPASEAQKEDLRQWLAACPVDRG